MAQDTEKLKAAFANIKDEKEQNLAQLKTRRELPRQPDSFRQRMVHNYMSGKTGSKGANKMSLMEKIRKETRDTKNLKMSTPTKDLKMQASPVTKAPKAFLEEVRKPQQRMVHTSPTLPASRVAAPPLAVSRPSHSSNDRSLSGQEARLRALTSGRCLPRQDAMPISSLDGPSSPPALDRGRRNPIGDPAISSKSVHQHSASRPGSSAHFLELGSSVHSPAAEDGFASPTKSTVMRSPKTPKQKRKAPLSVHMGTKRPKVSPASIDEYFKSKWR
jgi:hypothetical protein